MILSPEFVLLSALAAGDLVLVSFEGRLRDGNLLSFGSSSGSVSVLFYTGGAGVAGGAGGTGAV